MKTKNMFFLSDQNRFGQYQKNNYKHHTIPKLKNLKNSNECLYHQYNCMRVNFKMLIFIIFSLFLMIFSIFFNFAFFS